MADEQHGGAADNASGNDDAAKFVTSEQLNKAITERFNRFEQKLDQKLTASADSIGKSILSHLQKADEEDADADDDADDDGGKDDKPAAKTSADPVDDKIEKLTRKFQRQLADEKRARQKIEQEREEERQKNKDSQLRSAVRDELAKVGIVDLRQKQALTWLLAEGRVTLEDDESVKFRDEDGLMVSLGEGVGSWVKSDDAKVFLPPRGVGGSGDKPNTGKAGANNDRAEERRAAILKGMFG